MRQGVNLKSETSGSKCTYALFSYSYLARVICSCSPEIVKRSKMIFPAVNEVTTGPQKVPVSLSTLSQRSVFIGTSRLYFSLPTRDTYPFKYRTSVVLRPALISCSIDEQFSAVSEMTPCTKVRSASYPRSRSKQGRSASSSASRLKPPE